MKYKIQGTTFPSLDIMLEPGESVYTEKGGMAWIRGHIEMSTNTRGGFIKGLTRKLAGESLFLTTYSCHTKNGIVTFTPEAPGSILHINLNKGESRICQKDAFMVAEDTIALEIHFKRRLGAGFFGGEGFVLQKLTGPGNAWVEIAGDLREYDLNVGETIRVDPGHIAMYEPTVNYDIERIKGISNLLFGGEGLFLATLTGPGRVWLQTMPLSDLALKLYSQMPIKGNG